MSGGWIIPFFPNKTTDHHQPTFDILGVESPTFSFGTVVRSQTPELSQGSLLWREVSLPVPRAAEALSCSFVWIIPAIQTLNILSFLPKSTLQVPWRCRLVWLTSSGRLASVCRPVCFDERCQVSWLLSGRSWIERENCYTERRKSGLGPQEDRWTLWPSALLLFLRTVFLGASQQTSEYPSGARPFSWKRMARVKLLIWCQDPPPCINSLNTHSFNAIFIHAYCVPSMIRSKKLDSKLRAR